MSGRHQLRVPEVRVSGAQDDVDDPPAALPPFALTLASIPRRRHSWICGFSENVTLYLENTPSSVKSLKPSDTMLPIAEMKEGASNNLQVASASRHRRTRDRVVTAEVRALRRRRGWTVVGSETR
ncbi:hypothetical protein RR46_11081 [Papilio xuthus]|uniref:Uncharacterized protein n=1 Tax=Papilio xuthus TaxID=66420 RepID=A0A194Q3H0_PAPXU|nr:hypothetical protein RR46_11081 [Papilio xuthus]